MIKSVTVINYLGESLEMPLADPYLTGFAITSIEGLGPGKSTVNVTELTSSDGSLYNSARIGTRNIVMTIRFVESSMIEVVRHKTYQYFPLKKTIRLIFNTDTRSCYIDGYVESNEPNIFSKNEETQISILCPDPYFYSLDTGTSIFSGVVSEFEFPFSNETTSGTGSNISISHLEFSKEKNVYYSGEGEIGMTIHINSVGTAENVTIYNVRTREFIRIDTDKLETLTGSKIVSGDEIVICTVKGKKSITLIRDGEETNIFNCMTKDSSWLQLVKGDNIMAYTADEGAEMLYFRIHNNIIYEGV